MDEDFALALRLQLEEDERLKEARNQRNGGSIDDVMVVEKSGLSYSTNSVIGNRVNSKPLSVVDEAWELIDPVPNIIDLFLQFNDAFFDGLLAGVEVKWSSRMTLCAGLCSYEGRGGLCSIRLSQPLLKLRPRRDLVQTLLHEMIHAVLFVTHNNRDHDAHGPEFLKHMNRINKQTGSNITVYHNFHDEVNNYRQHWWRCDGPCQKRPPYYGIVRRAMNRAPSKNDTWWADHMRTCGGKYTKIKEPDDYGKKKSKRKRDETSISKNPVGIENLSGNSQKTLSFPGKGKTLDGNENEKISKWFKPVGEANEVIPIKRSPLKNISTACEKKIDVYNETNSSNATNDQVLGSEKTCLADGRAAWIEKLMKKQEEAIERRKKAISNVKVNESKTLSNYKNEKIMWNKTKKHSDIRSTFERESKDEKADLYSITQKLDDGGWSFNGGEDLKQKRKEFINNRSVVSSVTRKTLSTTEQSSSMENSSTLSSSPILSSSSSASSFASPSSSSLSSLSSSLTSYSSLLLPPPSSSSSSKSSILASSSSMASSSSASSSSSFVLPSSASSSSFSSLSSSLSSYSSLLLPPSSSSSSSSSKSSTLASSSSIASSSSASSVSSSSSSTSSVFSDSTCPGFQIISRSVNQISSIDNTAKANQSKSKITENTKRKPIVLDDSFTSNSDNDDYVSCPVCPKKVSIHSINIHLDECLSRAS